MKLAIGIDVHKTSCTAHAAYAGMGRPRQRHLDYIETFNEDFRKFHSDCRGMMELHNRIKEHDVHILIENSTKSHDIYWMLKGMDHEIVVAHAFSAHTSAIAMQPFISNR